MGLWVLIFIVVLQQFDGVILGPRILGDSIGLKPIGVIFAIIVGGAIAGPLGMFFGVPIFSVIFTIFSNFVEKLYNSKNTVKNKLEKETKKMMTPKKANRFTFFLLLYMAVLPFALFFVVNLLGYSQTPKWFTQAITLFQDFIAFVIPVCVFLFFSKQKITV